MTGKINLKILTVVLLSITLLTACLNKATPAPTLDVNLIYTQAAQTMAVQLSLTAAAMPTNTLVPTNTVAAPTLSINTPPPLPTLPGTTPVITLQLPGFATATPSGAKKPDQAQWVENNPVDYSVIGTNTRFDITWRMKNTGTTTWNIRYIYRYYSGTRLYENRNSYPFREEVKPGQEGLFIVDGIAPSTAGTYTMTWVLTNPDGENFGVMDITLVVGSSTAVPTPDPNTYCCPWDSGANPHASEPVCKTWRKNCNTCPAAIEPGDVNIEPGCP